MADVPNQRTSPWIAFLAGAVATLAIVLLLFAWSQGEGAAERLRLALRDAPDLPTLPRAPDAPRLPAVPIPQPK